MDDFDYFHTGILKPINLFNIDTVLKENLLINCGQVFQAVCLVFLSDRRQHMMTSLRL